MARPGTRSSARGASGGPSVPQKRKRAPRGSATNGVPVQGSDRATFEQKHMPSPALADDELSPDGKESPSNDTFEIQPHGESSPHEEPKMPSESKLPMRNGSQTAKAHLSELSPTEGDSGISLGGLDKDSSSPRKSSASPASPEARDMRPKHESTDAHDDQEQLSASNGRIEAMAAVYDEKSGPLTAPPAAQPSSIKKESDIPDPAAEELVKTDDIPAVRSSHESAPPLRIVANDHQSEGSYEELPHNLGTTFVAKKSPASDSPSAEVSRKSQDHFDDKAGVNAVVSKDKSKLSATTPQEQATQGDAPKKKAKKSSYGLTPGETPFPDFKAPTPEVCRKVNDLLSQAHGKVIAPKTIPEPSLTVTGCGEVPSVLDALIRTLLSGATTGTNSARAFNGLVQRFGTLEDGIGKGSVNWDAVRQAPLKDVFKAIERGGLADVKSKNLKKLLDQVYEENQERKHRHDTEDTLVMDQKNSDSSSGDTKEAEKVKEYDIATVNEHFLNLQYLHKYKTVDALKALIRYPGIGPKTAACVLLFCLQRPCFAVDTHIFRICKWLGWVPPNANEITAFSHLDVRIPDDLKYSLHQLLIKHGKQCPRCRAITSPSSADWDKGCVIEDFVKRSGRKVLEKPHARAETGASKKISAQVKKDVNTTSKSKKPSRSSVKSAGKTRAITRASSESEDTMSDLTDNSSEDNMEIDDSGESTSDQDQKAPSRNLKRKRGGVKASTGLRQQPEAKAASSKKKSNMKQAESKIKPAKPLTAPTRRSSRLNRV